MRKQFPQAVCPDCGSTVGVSGGWLAEHEGADGRKCKNGPPPKRSRGKVRKSVYTVNGGLPTLGKRK